MTWMHPFTFVCLMIFAFLCGWNACLWLFIRRRR
jgi:hypothetical protein